MYREKRLHTDVLRLTRCIGNTMTKKIPFSATEPAEDLSLAALAVLIPAWQPDARLPGLVRELLSRGFGKVLIVDDGSHTACAPVLAELAAIQHVTLLHHPVNRGKGRALKTGFGYFLEGQPEAVGVVTADADGQHAPEDIARVGRTLLHDCAHSVLGVRALQGDVPLRSRLGNTLTRKLFTALTGTALTDTQTGLRGLPREALSALMGLPGERYEYEMTALAHLCRHGPRPVEVPIATIYLEGNRGSHFHPLWDSLRVLRALLRSPRL